MRILAKILQDGERPVGKTRLHGIYLIKGLVWLGGFSALGWAIDYNLWLHLSPYIPQFEIGTSFFGPAPGWIGWLFTACGALIFLSQFVAFISTSLVVTSQRVLYKTGLIKTKLDATDISDILGVHVDQGWLGQFFGYGKLHFDCRFIADVYIPYIKNPYGVMNALEKIRKTAHQNPVLHNDAAPLPVQPVSQTLIQISGSNPVYIVDKIPSDQKTPLIQLPKALGDTMLSSFHRKA
jgi:hypothetical protein